jgi:glucosamine--fructose-6-phosphate aminotransferase (isomerizing)
VLQEKSPQFDGTTGIGHTRWATHGAPSMVNAHPHLDCTGRFAVVHNGVITNYKRLRQQLISEGHNFISETDTEVIPHLIEKYYQGNLENAVDAALSVLEGSYAIIVLSEDEPKLVVARRDSPVVVGIGDGENFIASDVPAIINYTSKVEYLENGDVCVITKDSIKIRQNGKETTRKARQVIWSREDIQKTGYEHFMLKEIHEQPRVIQNNIGGDVPLNQRLILGDAVQDVLILACGTSYHAGLIGEYIIEELLGIPTRVVLASEFNHRRIIAPNEAIVITQSGETADVLLAMKKLQDLGSKMLAITNVPESSASRLADRVVYINAGPEVSVAATKSFIAELITLYQLVLSHPSVHREIRDQLVMDLRQLPATMQRVFDTETETQIVDCARYLSKYESAFFIGRGINFPVALEGALKLKEIAYIHAEGYAAGELKHGPLALLCQDVPVIAIIAQDDNYEAMLTNIKEVKTRNAHVIALADENCEDIDELVDAVIRVPHTHSLFSPVVNTGALQLLAYHTAKLRGCPIDFPRNLAKSVTVL